MNRHFHLASAELVVPTQDACLLWDFMTLQQIVDTFPGKHYFTEQGSGGSQRDRRRVPQWNARKLAEQVFGKGWEAKADSIYIVLSRARSFLVDSS